MQVSSISSNTNINNTRKTGSSSVSGGNFQSYLGESKDLDAIFQKAAKKYGVDVNFLKSVARVESNFRADAVSCVGAVGIMQLMPRTAKGLGVKNSYDPEQNIMGGAKLLSQLMKKYNGDLEMTLAGYNAGSGNVQKYGGVPPWKSVHNYIKKVLGFYKNSDSGSASSVATTNTETKTQAPATKTTTTPVTTPTTTPDVSTTVTSAYQTAGATSSADQLTAMLDALNLVSEDKQEELDEIFSYEKYLKFIELYFDQQEEEKEQDEEDNNSVISSATKLQISSSVSNMLKLM